MSELGVAVEAYQAQLEHLRAAQTFGCAEEMVAHLREDLTKAQTAMESIWLQAAWDRG